MTVSVRLATKADLPAAAAVHIESCLDIYRPFVSEEVHTTSLPANLRAIWAAEQLQNGDFILLAEKDDKAIGLVTVRNQTPAYIDHFHVSPTEKGQGIGRVLMREAVREMRNRGHNTCYLDFALGNGAAKAFYVAMGGELGEETEGDLFGHPLPAQIVRWSDLTKVDV